MSFEIITILSLVGFMFAREVMHFLQVSKLQELLKSVDVTEYYKAKSLTHKAQSPSANQIVEEPNEIMNLESPDFDITKVSKLNVDGDERDIQIIS
jgi:hypothetical protein